MSLLLAGCLGLLSPSLSAGGDCRPTEPNPRGPFYLPGAPFREVLAEGNEPGRRIEVSGRGLAPPDCRPVPGAVLDVWHASAAGVYYNLEGVADRATFRLRGKVKADDEGRYLFRTVLPGHYPVGLELYRPRHLHVIASAPGHPPLTTQVYFSGDPYLSGDPLVRQGLVADLGSRRGADSVSFDFILDIPR